jgi:primosomal protein N' (replication factor Y)
VIEAVNETLAKSEQALLFLNRRGYAPLTLCRACGHRFTCPQCTAYLVEHRLRGRLICHHCGFSLPFPKNCPACHREGMLAASGPGIERVTEEVSNRWPAARICVLSSDLVPTTAALREILARITAGEVDIIVGTQLVSKGHNFPKLSFVGVVDGDLSLATADPRAGERTFQLLHQVTGRAGRFGPEGRGLIQTHFPDHPVMQALVTGDRKAFYEAEIAMREEARLPPFGRLAAIIVSAKTKPEAETYARELGVAAPAARAIEVLGPVEAPLAIIRGRHRQRLLVKAAREADLQGYLIEWLGSVEPPRGSLKVNIDVDPYNFL